MSDLPGAPQRDRLELPRRVILLEHLVSVLIPQLADVFILPRGLIQL